MTRLCAFAGAWGMVTGFALFIVIEEKWHEWWIVVAAVLLAALAAAVVEWFRHVAEGRSVPRPTLTRVLSFFVLLIVFELFIFAVHDLAKYPEEWHHVLSAIFGAGTVRGALNLGAFVGLWILLGGILGATLASAVDRMPTQARGLQDALWIGLKTGLKAGLVYIPLVVFAYAVLVRFGWAFYTYYFSPAHTWLLPSESVWDYLAPLLVIALIAGMLGEALSEREYGRAIFVSLWFLFALMNFYLTPKEDVVAWGDRLWRMGQLAIDVGVIWAVPAIVLGVLMPFLRRPSQFPWLWSPLALGAALISLVFGIAAQQWWWLLPTVLLLAAGLLFRRSERLEDLWPLLAASVAMVAFLVAQVPQMATPLAMYSSIRAVVIPSGIGEREWAHLLPLLRPIDREKKAELRIEKYEGVLERVDNFDRDQRHLPMRAWTFVKTDVMSAYVKELVDLEKTVLGKEPLAGEPCKCKSKEPDQARRLSRADTFGLATTGALSFWVTLGLLGAWHVRRGDEAPESDSTGRNVG